MTVKELLKHAEKFEVDTYKLPRDFRENHISFTGTPEKHPYADDKIILISDPFSMNISYYEFVSADIAGVEDLPNLVNVEGTSVKMCRVWVRRGSIGVRSVPFVVEDTTRR
ncbi:MAG: inorganic pyrophosphatase Ppa [Deltaproteobacteria bacterium]|nr:inorganic pyrophosphatase Ppa [Deltaproteobacteria bacterium]